MILLYARIPALITLCMASRHSQAHCRITDAAGAWFEVSLIPTTLAMTTLGAAEPGTTVNLEADVIAKYVERLLAARDGSPGQTAPGAE